MSQGLIFSILVGSLAIVTPIITLWFVSRPWSELARVYAVGDKPFEGRLWRFQNVTVNRWTQYNHCVTVGANREGLRFSVLLNILHKPVLIPWSDLEATVIDVFGLFRKAKAVRITCSQVPGVELRLSYKLMQQIAEYMKTMRSTDETTLLLGSPKAESAA